MNKQINKYFRRKIVNVLLSINLNIDMGAQNDSMRRFL